MFLLSCTLYMPCRNTDRRLQRPLQMSRSCAKPTRSLRKIALYSPVRRSYLLLDKSKRFNSDSWRLQKSSGFALTVAPRTGKGGGEPRSPRDSHEPDRAHPMWGVVCTGYLPSPASWHCFIEHWFEPSEIVALKYLLLDATFWESFND